MLWGGFCGSGGGCREGSGGKFEDGEELVNIIHGEAGFAFEYEAAAEVIRKGAGLRILMIRKPRSFDETPEVRAFESLE